MAATLALAGDTMLGRGVAERLSADPAAPLIAPQVADQLATADAFVLNLECCISDRGEPFPDPGKPFFFRAPPVAASRLAELGGGRGHTSQQPRPRLRARDAAGHAHAPRRC